MGLSDISVIIRNQYLYAELIKAFLRGFNKSCPIRKLFYAVTILEYGDTREKLLRANSKSSFSSLFSKDVIFLSTSLSWKSRMIGFAKRYKCIEQDVKKSLILLVSQNEISVDYESGTITIIDSPNHYYIENNSRISNYLKASQRLGAIFQKTSDEELEYYMGVCIK